MSPRKIDPSDDPLLAGLSRLPSSTPALHSPHTLPTLPTLSEQPSPPPQPSPPAPTPPQRLRPVAVVPRTSPQRPAPPSPMPTRAEPLHPMSRADMLQLIEHATGMLGKPTGDRAAAERLLHAVRAAMIDAVALFRGIVAGSDPAVPPFNIRVLALVHTLCVVGGPTVLHAALHAAHPRRPIAALRVVLDVLRNAGVHDPEDAIHDDALVRSQTLVHDARPKQSKSTIAVAVHSYAIALGRKLVFHQRYPDVEVNYSLDRFYRTLHVENVQAARREKNDERQTVIISHAALADVALIARAATIAAQKMQAAAVDADIFILALGEATNAYIFAEYLRMKTSSLDLSDYDLADERKWLRRALRATVDAGGNDVRLLKRYVDGNVFRAICDADARPCRPESRHRREIRCWFTSFESLHNALAPPKVSTRAHNTR